MNNLARLSPVVLLLALGGGCVDIPEQYSAEDLDLSISSQITLEQKSLDLLPSKTDQPTWTVTIDELQTGNEVKAHWERREERETAESQAARAAAQNTPVGEEQPAVPDPVYETIVTNGTLSSQALDSASQITLPTSWPANDELAGGEDDSLLWLSKSQYDELAQTRHTHIELGLFDKSLSNVLDFAESIKGILSNLSGEEVGNLNVSDFTELEARPDWGTYYVEVDGDKKRVSTIIAENRFAKYTILANPENPLILEVDLRPLAFGTNFLSSLGAFGTLTGYHVTNIVPISAAPASADQPEHPAQ